MPKRASNVIIPAFETASEAETVGKLYGLIFDVDGVIADTEAVNADLDAAGLRWLAFHLWSSGRWSRIRMMNIWRVSSSV